MAYDLEMEILTIMESQAQRAAWEALETEGEK